MKNNNQTGTTGTNAKSYLAGSINACRNLATKFNQLKDTLMQKFAREYQSLVPSHLLQQAIVEAEALAWSTPYPLLFLPDLAEEKVLNARQWTERQQQILARQQQTWTHAH